MTTAAIGAVERFPACVLCRRKHANDAHDPKWIWARAGKRVKGMGDPVHEIHLERTQAYHLAHMIVSLAVQAHGHRWQSKQKLASAWLPVALAEAARRGMPAFTDADGEPSAETKFRGFARRLSDEDLAQHYIAAEIQLNNGEPSDFLGYCVRWLDEEIARRAAEGVKVAVTPFDPLEHDPGVLGHARAAAQAKEDK